jgi:DNA polymerase III alpha subunit (gram-positive type)
MRLSSITETEPLPPCARCKEALRLVGIESAEKPHYDLYTFECPGCGRLETRTVRVQ